MSTESNEPTPTTPEARGVEFETIEPWPEPVDGDELLFELSAEIRRYVFLPNEAVIAAALWVPHTYVFETAHVSPILAIVSPVQREVGSIGV